MSTYVGQVTSIILIVSLCRCKRFWTRKCGN